MDEVFKGKLIELIDNKGIDKALERPLDKAIPPTNEAL